MWEWMPFKKQAKSKKLNPSAYNKPSVSIKQCKMSETIEESLKIVRENTQNEKQSLKIEQELVFQIINSISEAQYQVQQLREQFEKGKIA